MGKKTVIPPKYPHRPTTLGVSLEGGRFDEHLPVLMYANPLRRRAGNILNAPFSDNRLTLALALIIVIGLGFAVPMVLDSLLMLADVLMLLSPTAKIHWVLILYGCLMGVVTVFLTLPLFCSLCRMAVLMSEAHRKSEAGGTCEKVSIGEILYPLTSMKAYGRTLYVALRGMGHFLLSLFPAVAVMVAAFWWMPMVKHSVAPLVYILLWVANIAVAFVLLALMLILAARNMGFAYFVFACPQRSLKESGRAFKSSRSMGILPLWMLLGYTGWILVSLVAVFIPFLIHTLPHMLLAGASYGRFLMDTEIPAEEAVTATPENQFQGGKPTCE